MSDPKIIKDFRTQGNYFAVYFNGTWRALFELETHAEEFILHMHDNMVAAGCHYSRDEWQIKTLYADIKV